VRVRAKAELLQSDLFVLPSAAEKLRIALRIEALAFRGTPVDPDA